MTSGVYRITERDTGRCYIGRSTNVEKRWRTHMSHARRGSNASIHTALRERGVEAFDFDVIEECEPELQPRREYELIWEHRAFLDGFNDDGGGGRLTEFSAAAREKLHAKRSPLTDEHKARLSSVMRGRRLSDETRMKMSATHTGVRLSEAHRQSLNEAWKKRKREQT